MTRTARWGDGPGRPVDCAGAPPPDEDHIATVIWAVLFVVFVACAFAQSGCVRTVTVCTQYDRRLGTDSNGWQRDGASASVCAEVVPPGAAQ